MVEFIVVTPLQLFGERNGIAYDSYNMDRLHVFELFLSRMCMFSLCIRWPCWPLAFQSRGLPRFFERFAQTVCNSKFALDSNAGHSSVGRASDCRSLQPSDGAWFDAGWPDICTSPMMRIWNAFYVFPRNRTKGCASLESTLSQVWEAFMMLARTARAVGL